MPAAVIVRALFTALRSAIGRLSRRSLRTAALRMLTCRFITGLACAGLAVGLGLLTLRLLGLCALLRTLLCGVLRLRGGLRIGRLLPAMTAGAAARALFLLALLGVRAVGLLVAVDIVRKQLRQRPRIFLRLFIAHRLRPILEQGRQRFARLRAAAGDHGDLIGLIAFEHILTLTVKLDLQAAAQDVDGRHCAVARRRLDKGTDLRYSLDQILIRRLLIAQAAHQAAAGAGDLRRVERHGLHLRHLRRDGLKVVQKLAAAVRTAADADAAEHLRLVAHADLAQLDAVAEHGGEILDQLAEVNTPVGREEEHSLVALEAALDVHELHIQTMLGDFLLADLKRLFFAAAVDLLDAQVVLRSDARKRAQRLHARLIRHDVVSENALGQLQAARGLDDDLVARAHGDSVRVKEIDLAAVFEFHTDYFCQFGILTSEHAPARRKRTAGQRYALR